MRTILLMPALALAAISPYLFVKAGAADGQVAVAAAATDKLLGISNQVGFAANDTSEYVALGEAKLKLGGTVALGDPLTSDASGQGITTSTAGNRVGAIALQAGVIGDVIAVQVIPFAKF